MAKEHKMGDTLMSEDEINELRNALNEQLPSQDEIEQLVNAINAGDTENGEFVPAPDTRKIKIYDFRRPDRFSREQIRTVYKIHETFAREIITNLSKRLGAMVHIHVTSVDQLTYDEFMRSIPMPTTIAVLKMPPLPGNIVIEIDPACTAAMINRIFGGFGECKPDHELTFLEEKAIADIIELNMLPALRKSWERILETEISIEKIETRPEYCMIAPSAEMVLLATLECKIENTESMINIGIPYSTLYTVLEKLSVPFRDSNYYDTHQLMPETRPDLFQALDDSYMPISVEFGKTIKSMRYLSKIGEGTIIELDKLAGEEFDIIAGDYVIAKGEVLVLDEKFGIRITKVGPNKRYNPWANHRGFFPSNDPYKSTPVEPLDNINVPVCVELGGTKTSPLGEIEPGSILKLDKLAGELLDVIAGGCCIAKGKALVIDDNFGILIKEIKGKGAERKTDE
jgi:flagellar motor switch protein FliM